MKDTIEIIKGVIELEDNGEGHDVLKVGRDIFAERFEELLCKHESKLVSVRYYVSDQIIRSLDKANEEFMKRMMGASQAGYSISYSETTGYLGTNESCRVGGHDLIDELGTSAGKYLLMEVTFHDQRSYERGITAARDVAITTIQDLKKTLEFHLQAPCLEKVAIEHLHTGLNTLTEASSEVNLQLERLERGWR